MASVCSRSTWATKHRPDPAGAEPPPGPLDDLATDAPVASTQKEVARRKSIANQWMSSLKWVFEDLLVGVPLIARLSRRDLSRLVKSGHDVTYPAGTALTSAGEDGICLFVIAEGEAG